MPDDSVTSVPAPLAEQLKSRNGQFRLLFWIDTIQQCLVVSTYFSCKVEPRDYDPTPPPSYSGRKPRRRGRLNRLINLYRSMPVIKMSNISFYKNGVVVRGFKKSPAGRNMLYKFWIPKNEMADPVLFNRIFEQKPGLLVNDLYKMEMVEANQTGMDLVVEFFEDVFRQYSLRRRRGRPRKYPLSPIPQEVPQ